MIADGNAANFLHGAIIGPAIQLIEGEKLKAISALIAGNVPKGLVANPPKQHPVMTELQQDDRAAVAKVWNQHFL